MVRSPKIKPELWGFNRHEVDSKWSFFWRGNHILTLPLWEKTGSPRSLVNRNRIGTLGSAATWEKRQLGWCLAGDGSNGSNTLVSFSEFINVFNFDETVPWTIWAIFEVDDTVGDDRAIWAKWESAIESKDFLLRTDQETAPASIECYFEDTLILDSSASIELNVPYLVVVSNDTINFKMEIFEIGGKKIDTQTNAAVAITVSTNSKWTINGRTVSDPMDGGFYAGGLIEGIPWTVDQAESLAKDPYGPFRRQQLRPITTVAVAPGLEIRYIIPTSFRGEHDLLFKIPVDNLLNLVDSNKLSIEQLQRISDCIFEDVQVLSTENGIVLLTEDGTAISTDDDLDATARCRIIPIENLVDLVNAKKSPVEFSGGAAVEFLRNVPIEYVLEFNNLYKITAEVLGGISSQNKIPVEILSSIFSSSKIPTEFLISSLVEDKVPIEYLAEFTDFKKLPIESLQGIDDDIQIPIETLLEISDLNNFPVEVIGELTDFNKIPVEHLLNIIDLNKLSIEQLEGISSITKIPIEYLATLSDFSKIPVEFEGRAVTTFQKSILIESLAEILDINEISIENIAPISDFNKIPVEYLTDLADVQVKISLSFLLASLGLNKLPIEYLLNLQLNKSEPIESITEIKGVLAQPVESLLSLSKTNKIPVEYSGAATFTVAKLFPIEIIGVLQEDKKIPVENLSELAITKNVAIQALLDLQPFESKLLIEYLEGLKDDSIIPVEIFGVETATNILKWVLLHRGTVWSIPKAETIWIVPEL